MAINTYKEDENLVNASKKSTILRVISYLKNYKGSTILAIIMILAQALIKTFMPKVTEYAIDVCIANNDIPSLIKVCSQGVILAITICILLICNKKILSKMTNEIIYEIRKEAFAHLETLSLYYFDSRPTGKILSRLISDVTSLKEMLSKLIMTLIPSLVTIITVMIIMISSSPILSISAFIVVPLLVGSIYIITVKGFKNWENFRIKNSNMNAYTHESYSGIRVIQAFGAENESIEEGDRIMAETQEAWVKAVRRAELLNIVINWSQGIGYFVLYFLAVRWLKMDETSVGELTAFAAYVTLFWHPIRALAGMYNQFTNQLTGAGRVFELLDTKSILQEKPDAKELEVSE